MKITIFLIVFVAVMLLIPDGVVDIFIDKNIHISGDGEEAMDSFAFSVILIKALISALIAFVVLWLTRKRKA